MSDDGRSLYDESEATCRVWCPTCPRRAPRAGSGHGITPLVAESFVDDCGPSCDGAVVDDRTYAALVELYDTPELGVYCPTCGKAVPHGNPRVYAERLARLHEHDAVVLPPRTVRALDALGDMPTEDGTTGLLVADVEAGDA